MWHFFCEHVHKRSTVLPATLAQMHTHLVLIKNLWVCVLRHCCVTPDFVAWKKKISEGMADWNNYRTDRNTRAQKQKRLSENVESLSERRRYKKREDNEERIRHKLEERETRQQQD